MYKPNGVRIRELREARGLSLRAVASAANVSRRTLEEFETGIPNRPRSSTEVVRRDFNYNVLARIAEVLRVPYPFHELIEDVTEPIEAGA